MRSHTSVGRRGGVLAAAGGLLLLGGSAAAQELAEVQKLFPADGEAGEGFGGRLSVSGEWMIATSQSDDDRGVLSGSAYAYRREAAGWTLVQKLTASDGLGDDLFGISVQVDGATAVIGAFGDDDPQSNRGSAYVFTQSDGLWTQRAKLRPSDGGALDEFGVAVGLAGGTAIVGSRSDDDRGVNSGSAYVFRGSGAAWTQVAKLVPADGARGDYFGNSLAIDGAVAVIGAPQTQAPAGTGGLAYVYTDLDGVWTRRAKLAPADLVPEDRFGETVAVRGDVVLVSAPYARSGGLYRGAVYVFRRNGDLWEQEARLLPQGALDRLFFGWGVALDDGVALLGGDGASDRGERSGFACLFRRLADGRWVESQRLVPTDGGSEQRFGVVAGLQGGEAFVGAGGAAGVVPRAGAAYVFQVPPACRPDLDGDGTVDAKDYGAFVKAFEGGVPPADFNGDGFIDFFDYDAFLAGFEAGC